MRGLIQVGLGSFVQGFGEPVRGLVSVGLGGSVPGSGEPVRGLIQLGLDGCMQGFGKPVPQGASGGAGPSQCRGPQCSAIHASVSAATHRLMSAACVLARTSSLAAARQVLLTCGPLSTCESCMDTCTASLLSGVYSTCGTRAHMRAAAARGSMPVPEAYT